MTLDEQLESIGTNNLEIRKDDLVSRTVSFVGNLPTKALFLSTKIGSYPKQETQNYVKEYLRNSKLEDTTVRIGHSRILKDVLRLFSDKKLKKTSLLGRILLGIPTTLYGGLIAKLTRADHYNPFTKTAVIYSDVPAIAMHELGHAKDYQEKNSPTLYSLARVFAPVMLYQEYVASRKAYKNLKENEKWQSYRYLMPAFSTYIAPVAGLAAFPFLAATHAVSNAYGGIKNFFKRRFKRKKLSLASAI